MRLKQQQLILVLLLLSWLTACAGEDDPQVVTVIATRPPTEITRLVTEIVTIPITLTPSPLPAPSTPAPKHLTICLLTEPQSLYWYNDPPFGSASLNQTAILHAVYENLYTTRSYDFQAQGLIKLPQIGDDDVIWNERLVQAGDTVVDSQNRVVQLEEGTRLRNSAGQEVIFTGAPITLMQMQVRFTFQPLVWSDGEPVTAQDSVFSFKVARDPGTPGNKNQIVRTASYVALDERTVEWRGLPGWADPFYFTNVWMPLPAHQLAGFSAADLLRIPETTLFPLSTGPFVVREWVEGHHIKLSQNEYYYRQNEGFPHLDSLTFRFVANTDQLLALLMAGECHIATQEGLDLSQAMILKEAESRGLLTTYFQTSSIFEHLDFGINSAFTTTNQRPDWFETPQVRQAIAMCTNRPAMAEAILYGLGQVSDSFVPPDHPLIPADLTTWGYDVAAANTLLDASGYLDFNGDGLRQDPLSSRTFRVTLGITRNNPTQQRLGELFASNMADCGIAVQLETHAPAEWFAPQGPLFGRRFDLAIFPWITDLTPACTFYTTASIPTAANSWQGNNETGWSNPAFDATCEQAQQALWGSEPFAAASQETFRLFAQELPSLPLFHYLKVSVTHPSVRFFQPDTTQPSELWNLYELDIVNP
jgi:peptide/nickel transport system substrate-binding protein